jgi:hypothetical protein
LIQGFITGTNEGFPKLISNIKNFRIGLENIDVKGRLAVATVRNLATGVFALSGAFGSLIKAIPLIGQLVIAIQLLGSALSFVLDRFRDIDSIEDTNKALDTQSKSIKTATKALDKYNAEIKDTPKTIDTLNKQLEIEKNILLELNNANKELLDNNQGFDELFGADIDDLTDNLNKQLEVLVELGAQSEVNEVLSKFGENEEIIAENALETLKPITELTTKMLDLTSATEEASNSITQSFDNLDDGIKKIQGSLPTLTGLQSVFLDLTNILNEIDTEDIVTQASRLGERSDVEADILGISNQVDNISKVTGILKDVNKEYLENKTRLQEINKELKNRRDNILTNLKKSFFSNEATNQELELERQQIKDNIKFQKDVLETGKKSYTDFVTSAKSDLITFRDELGKSITAQEELATIAQSLQFELSLPGLSTRDTLDITKQLSEVQEASLLATRKSATIALTSVQDALAGAEALIKFYNDIDQASKDAFLTNNPAFLAELNKAFKTVSDNAQFNLQLTLLTGEIDRKITANRIKNLDSIINKLKEVSEAEITQLVETGTSEILGDLSQVLIILGQDIKRENETIDQFRKRITDALVSINEFSKLSISGIGTAESIAAQNKALTDRIQAINLEKEFLKQNNSLIDERIDKEFVLARAQVERQLSEARAAFEDERIEGDDLTRTVALIANLEARLGLLENAGEALIAKQLDQEVKKINIAIEGKEKELKAGLRVTKASEEQIKLAQLKAELEDRAAKSSRRLK